MGPDIPADIEKFEKLTREFKEKLESKDPKAKGGNE